MNEQVSGFCRTTAPLTGAVHPVGRPTIDVGGCDWVLDILEDHIRGLLKGREHRRVDQHLVGCVACRAQALVLAASLARLGMAC